MSIVVFLIPVLVCYWYNQRRERKRNEREMKDKWKNRYGGKVLNGNLSTLFVLILLISPGGFLWFCMLVAGGERK